MLLFILNYIYLYDIVNHTKKGGIMKVLEIINYINSININKKYLLLIILTIITLFIGKLFIIITNNKCDRIFDNIFIMGK